MQPNQMFSLEGLTALVCGASQGIGKATAHAMARQGAKVVLLARNVEALEQVRNQLDQPERHLCITADLSSANEIDSAIEKMITKGFSPEILVNNAGGPSSGPLLDAHPETFEAAFRAHVLAQLQLSQKLVPAMKNKNFGRIINIISTSVRVPIANLGASNTIRAAVAGFAKTLSNELAPSGITVNNVLPGFTQTERLESLIQAAANRLNLSPQSVSDTWVKQVPMGRFAKAEELAATIAFLASREAGYITGTSIQVDGGRIGAI